MPGKQPNYPLCNSHNSIKKINIDLRNFDVNTKKYMSNSSKAGKKSLIKEVVCKLWEKAFSLSCRESDEKINSTLTFVH